MGYPSKKEFHRAKIKLVNAGFTFSHSIMHSDNDQFFGSVYVKGDDTFWLNLHTLSAVDSYLAAYAVYEEERG